jgi:hypothetical protein
MTVPLSPDLSFCHYFLTFPRGEFPCILTDAEYVITVPLCPKSSPASSEFPRVITVSTCPNNAPVSSQRPLCPHNVPVSPQFPCPLKMSLCPHCPLCPFKWHSSFTFPVRAVAARLVSSAVACFPSSIVYPESSHRPSHRLLH